MSKRSSRRAAVGIGAVAWIALALALGGAMAADREPAGEGAASVRAGAPGTYTVVECAEINPDAPDAEITNGIGFDARSRCDFRDGDRDLRIESTDRVPEGRRARISFEAPPDARIVAVDVRANLERADGNSVRLFMADEELRENALVASGSENFDGTRVESWSGSGQQILALQVECQAETCPQSSRLRARMKNVRMVLEDLSPPEITSTEGSLVGGGWLQDRAELSFGGLDSGGGISRLRASVNEATISTTYPDCSYDGEFAFSMRPCSVNQEISADSSMEVTEMPFVDGENRLQLCVDDIAALSSCRTLNVNVDSTPPRAAFVDGQLPSDPELVRAAVADQTSGIAGGAIRFRAEGAEAWVELPTELVGDELRARVDSASYPAGRYEFEVTAGDVAGNHAMSRLRADGQPMLLAFPLRADTRLISRLGNRKRGTTIAYGRSSRVRGRLLDASGRPVEGEDVTVIERFGDGALIDRRVRTVSTTASGAYRSTIPNGPSRRVSVEYAGDSRYLPDADQAGRLRVRSQARLKVSKGRIDAGSAVKFKGRVGRLGARIPQGGKLVELQVRQAGGGWNTIRESFATNRRGRFNFKYRFGRFYVEPVRFRFKAKVVREQGWPYLAPVRSKARSVLIKPR